MDAIFFGSAGKAVDPNEKSFEKRVSVRRVEIKNCDHLPS
jgi:hypothetical protein